MYKIIGADQKEYGPVNADEVRSWIAQGRANGQTLAMTEGGAWKPLSSFSEFAQALGNAPIMPPPPSPSGLAAAVASSGEAARLVQAPGIFLIIVGILGLAFALLNLLAHLVGWTFTAAQSTGNEELDRVMTFMSGGIGIVFDILATALSVLITVGGFRMLKLKNYGLCIATAVIALVPCLSPCCCLGLPAGIWALIVLSKPEVKAAFQRLV